MNTMMKSALSVVGTVLAISLFSPAAQAQATRTWVSGVGDDVNPCSRTAPCKTFAGAISKTATNGEINCLDPGGFGTLTITKSITVDCTGTLGGVLSASTNGFSILFDSFAVGDTRRTVRLRGIDINAVNTGLIGVRIVGGANSAGSAVILEDMVIDGMFAGGQRGISDERTVGGELSVVNSSIRNVGLFGVSLTGPVNAVFDNVRVQNSGGHALTFSGAARAVISRSVISGNTEIGVFSFGNAEVQVTNSVISNNGTGVQTSAGIVRLSNSDIVFNAVGFNGAWASFGNNRVAGNTNPGTGPTAASPGLQ
jgi:hypothetical protein